MFLPVVNFACNFPLLSLIRGFYHAVKFRVAEISFDYFSSLIIWNTQFEIFGLPEDVCSILPQP